MREISEMATNEISILNANLEYHVLRAFGNETRDRDYNQGCISGIKTAMYLFGAMDIDTFCTLNIWEAFRDSLPVAGSLVI